MECYSVRNLLMPPRSCPDPGRNRTGQVGAASLWHLTHSEGSSHPRDTAAAASPAGLMCAPTTGHRETQAESAPGGASNGICASCSPTGKRQQILQGQLGKNVLLVKKRSSTAHTFNALQNPNAEKASHIMIKAEPSLPQCSRASRICLNSRKESMRHI